MIVTMAGRLPAWETADRLANWGYRVLFVGRPAAQLRTDHRLSTARGFADVIATADWTDEDTREEWLADYDFVLIDGYFITTDLESPLYYRVPDLVVLPCRVDDEGVEAAERTVTRWTRLRTLLPVDRDQLLVVPAPEPDRFGRDEVAPLGRLCGNWCDTSVPIEDVLTRLFGGTVNQLAAFIAHRCARTDLLVSDPSRYFEVARKRTANASAGDVVVVRDERHDRLAKQLENHLRAARLDVPEISPFDSGSSTRAVCVLAGPGDTGKLANSVRVMTWWDHPDEPVPLIITALLPGARPSTLREPLLSGEWLTMETDRRHQQEAAQRIARLIRR